MRCLVTAIAPGGHRTSCEVEAASLYRAVFAYKFPPSVDRKALYNRGAMHIDVVFDGPPGPKPPGFVEVENEYGRSMNFGEWIERPLGRWALAFPAVGGVLVFDRAPGPELPRLIRVEDEQGNSADLGEWVQRPDKCGS